MGNEIKTVGILTSGGDAPGMNAAVRAVVRAGLFKGLNIVGVRHGFSGLLKNDMYEMNLRSVCDIIQRGGTILFSSRCPEFVEDEAQYNAIANCRERGIDGLIIIGGDGSFRGAQALTLKGLPCVAIPATIDNDIAASDYTIGFDTAVNTVVDMVDRIRDTSQSHDRCSIVEVMGRYTGHIALHAGICCGATAILVPEIPFDLDKDVVTKMTNTLKTGKQHFIILVAEGVGNTSEIGFYLEKRTGITTRISILGHVQRGGSPTGRERVVATEMGYHAIELMENGVGNRVVVYKADKIIDIDIVDALRMKKTIDMDLYRIANEVSI